MFKHDTFTQRRREALQYRHITQAEFARQIVGSLRPRNMYCTGNRIPPVDTFADMAHELGVSTDYLFYVGKKK